MQILTNEGDILKGNKIVCEARKLRVPKQLIKVEGIKHKELH